YISNSRHALTFLLVTDLSCGRGARIGLVRCVHLEWLDTFHFQCTAPSPRKRVGQDCSALVFGKHRLCLFDMPLCVMYNSAEPEVPQWIHLNFLTFLSPSG